MYIHSMISQNKQAPLLCFFSSIMKFATLGVLKNIHFYYLEQYLRYFRKMYYIINYKTGDSSSSILSQLKCLRDKVFYSHYALSKSKALFRSLINKTK